MALFDDEQKLRASHIEGKAMPKIEAKHEISKVNDRTFMTEQQNGEEIHDIGTAQSPSEPWNVMSKGSERTNCFEQHQTRESQISG